MKKLALLVMSIALIASTIACAQSSKINTPSAADDNILPMFIGGAAQFTTPEGLPTYKLAYSGQPGGSTGPAKFWILEHEGLAYDVHAWVGDTFTVSTVSFTLIAIKKNHVLLQRTNQIPME